MALSDELTWRGFIKDKTFDDVHFLDKPQTFYHGVDGSADSLTVGNLAALMLVKHFIVADWKPVLVVGGATTMVGDPGGKEEERPLPSKEEVSKNIGAIKEQIEKIFLDQNVVVVNNADWLEQIRLLDFLRGVGKNFSMTELMQREFVTGRMGEGGTGISYAEFSYSLIQGYDFWQLHKDHGVVLQVAGSDQWGNMLSGVALIRKKEAHEVHALSMPLIVDKETGRKFGKSEGGAVWLDKNKTSPTQFYQFWINKEDNEVENYLKIFTTLPQPKIKQLTDQQHIGPHKRPAQKTLAFEVTKFVHGKEAATKAQAHAETITSVSPSASISASPSSSPAPEPADYLVELDSGVSLVDALVKTGLADSNSEARRLIDEKAIYVNNQPFNDETLDKQKFENGNLLLRRGKKFMNSVRVKLT